jgi:hypothetical protein
MADELPDGWLTLRCPPGAENAPVSHGAESFRVYREKKDNDVWLVDVPKEAAFHLCRNGGFWPYEPGKPP